MSPVAVSREVLGGKLDQCERLQALPHMLQRGKLPKRYGPDRCAKLLALADKCPVIAVPSTDELDRFTGINDVDPGEAMLFARAAVGDCLLMTGDKRALKAVIGVPTITGPLVGKIVLLESLIGPLCEKLGIVKSQGKHALACVHCVPPIRTNNHVG